MNAMMAGMAPVMALLMMGRDMRAMDPTELVFWGVMSLGVAVGCAVAYPVNVWMVSRMMKHGLMTEFRPVKKAEMQSDSMQVSGHAQAPLRSAEPVATDGPAAQHSAHGEHASLGQAAHAGNEQGIQPVQDKARYKSGHAQEGHGGHSMRPNVKRATRRSDPRRMGRRPRLADVASCSPERTGRATELRILRILLENSNEPYAFQPA